MRNFLVSELKSIGILGAVFSVNANSMTFDKGVSKRFHGSLNDLKYSPHVIKHIFHVL